MCSRIFSIFRREPKVVDFFKSEIFGIFAVFNISRNDMVTIMEAFETVDTEFKQTINIPKFVKMYCGTYGYLFRIIWYKYVKAYRAQTMTMAEKYGVAGAAADSKDDDGHAQFDPHNPNYWTFLCFLLFIFSVDNKDVNRLVYWIWYTVDKVSIGYPELCCAIEDVWGKNVKYKDDVDNWKETVIKTVKNLDTDPMTPHKFQLLDWKIQTCWSAPVVNMLVLIKMNFCGVKFWRKHASNFNRVCERSVDDIRKDISQHITLQSTKSGWTDNGERHSSKTKLRQYFKFVHSYWHMGKGEKTVLEEGKGYFDFEWWNRLTAFYRSVRNWRIHPTGGLKEYIYETYLESDIDKFKRLNPQLSDVTEDEAVQFKNFKLKDDIPTDELRKKMHTTERDSLAFMTETIEELDKLPPIDYDLLEKGLEGVGRDPITSGSSKVPQKKKRMKKYRNVDGEEEEEDEDDDDDLTNDEDRRKSRGNSRNNNSMRRGRNIEEEDDDYADDDDISSIGNNTYS